MIRDSVFDTELAERAISEVHLDLTADPPFVRSIFRGSPSRELAGSRTFIVHEHITCSQVHPKPAGNLMSSTVATELDERRLVTLDVGRPPRGPAMVRPLPQGQGFIAPGAGDVRFPQRQGSAVLAAHPRPAAPHPADSPRQARMSVCSRSRSRRLGETDLSPECRRRVRCRYVAVTA